MNCCVNCFKDQQIKQLIVADNHIGDCDFCGSKNINICSVDKQSDISDLISKIISIYEPDPDGVSLFSLLVNDWNVFEVFPSAQDLVAAFCETIFSGDGYTHNTVVRIPHDTIKAYSIWGDHSWKDFSDSLKTKNRFFNGYFNADQMSSFLTFSTTTYRKDDIFYRARICRDGVAHGLDEMGIPPFEKRKAGRVNPEGVSVLYLASDEETAVREVRAGAFDFVSIGEFRLKRDITVVEIPGLSKISPVLYTGELESLAANLPLFCDMAKEIAKPLRRNDSPLEYLPTQYITEFIKYAGYSGVTFESTMGANGRNIAVFDDSYFQCVNVRKVEVKSIEYNYI